MLRSSLQRDGTDFALQAPAGDSGVGHRRASYLSRVEAGGLVANRTLARATKVAVGDEVTRRPQRDPERATRLTR
jgi:hypothetical protein